MPGIVETLAEVIHAQIETARVSTNPVWEDEKASWDDLPDWYQAALLKGAHAALAHLNIPKDSGPVDVGEAVRELRDLLALLEGFGLKEVIVERLRCVLRSLGVEVGSG